MGAAERQLGPPRIDAAVTVVEAAQVVGMADGPLGAYRHVPFCARVCPFCPYNKVVPRTGQPERYFDALLAEARAYVEAGAAGPAGFTSLYVGGGTPTTLPGLLRRPVVLR